MSNSRVVHTADAIQWLKDQPVIPGASFIGSLPDYSEFPHSTLAEWQTWFTETAALILSKTPDDGVAVFFQSDIKRDDVWIDKGYLVAKAAEMTGHSTLFHKVLCRAPAGQTTFGKPSYSHLLAFSKGVRPPAAGSTADVIPDIGDKTWVRGMGFHACRVACEFILNQTKTRTMINPFCGYGSALAVANSIGLDAIGIERSPKRAERARLMQVNAAGNGFAPLPGDPREASVV
jgi:hypothetical protein